MRQTSPLWRLLVIVEEKTGIDVLQLLGRRAEDSRIQLVRNEGRKLAGAINTGMRHAETDFVAVLLGDDMWAPEAVSVLLNRVTQYPEVDFFHSSRIVIDESDTAISEVFQSRQRFESGDFVHGSPVKHLLCWRKKKALAIGGLDESLNSVGPDDYDFPWTMAMGKAVVASNVGGHRELIQHGRTGLLFPAGDVAGLARTLNRLLDCQDLCQKLGRQASTWVRQSRSWDKVAAYYADMYAGALRQSKSEEYYSWTS